MSNLDKIIRTLDLAKSDARDQTLDGIIEYTLFLINEPVSVDDLIEYISTEFDIVVNKVELKVRLKELSVGERIIPNGSETYGLSESTKIELRKKEVASKNAVDNRYRQFEESLIDISDFELTSFQVRTIWGVFTEYLYESYLTHGRKALNALCPGLGLTESSDVDLTTLLSKHSRNITDNKLRDLFSDYVQIFPEIIDEDTIEYLVSLSQKAESFFALGLSPEEYEEIYNKSPFEWEIFVDTNFLYSILNLHDHPENDVCLAVLDIGIQLGLEFKYLSITKKEMEKKKSDFEEVIEKNLRPGHIDALLQSDNLDSFTRKYYQRKLKDFDNTPHPTDVLKHSQNILSQKQLSFYNLDQNKFFDLNKESILDHESKYSTMLKMIDEARVERGIDSRGAKDPGQIQHDIMLREKILTLRPESFNGFSEAKYFGITLDKTLIKFDEQELRRNNKTIPTFFYPPLLLKKLFKHLPVGAQDYRRAFISAISTPALENKSDSMGVSIRSTKYFYNMGIEDPSIIVSCLRDEMFLTEFRRLEGSEEELNSFVSSKINEQFDNMAYEIRTIESQLSEQRNQVSSLKQKKNEGDKKNEELKGRIEYLNDQMKLYNSTLLKLKQDLNKKDGKADTSIQRTLEDELVSSEIDSIQTENSELKEQLIQLLLNKKFKRWKMFGWLSLILIVGVFSMTLLVFMYNGEDWNFVHRFIVWSDSLAEMKKWIIQVVLTAVFGIAEFLSIKLFWNRIFNKENIQEAKRKFKTLAIEALQQK